MSLLNEDDIATHNDLSTPDARQVAKEAYIYGFSMAANYQTLHNLSRPNSLYSHPQTHYRRTQR